MENPLPPRENILKKIDLGEDPLNQREGSKRYYFI